MTHADALRAIGDEQFVELTTFRRNGTPVATPVWVARGEVDRGRIDRVIVRLSPDSP